MVKRYSEFQRMQDARRTAELSGMYVVACTRRDRAGSPTGVEYVLYRKAEPKGVRIGKRTSAAGLLALINKSAVKVKQ